MVDRRQGAEPGRPARLTAQGGNGGRVAPAAGLVAALTGTGTGTPCGPGFVKRAVNADFDPFGWPTPGPRWSRHPPAARVKTSE